MPQEIGGEHSVRESHKRRGRAIISSDSDSGEYQNFTRECQHINVTHNSI